MPSPLLRVVRVAGIYPPPSREWFVLREYTLLPPVNGSSCGNMPSPLPRVVRAVGIYPPPSREWSDLREYSPSSAAFSQHER
eukprot:4859463-Pyramimonas_sp.AAC.2